MNQANKFFTTSYYNNYSFFSIKIYNNLGIILEESYFYYIRPILHLFYIIMNFKTQHS